MNQSRPVEFTNQTSPGVPVFGAASVQFLLRKGRQINGSKYNSNRKLFSRGAWYWIAIGVLFTPKSGAEAREHIAKKTIEGNERARKKVRELRARDAALTTLLQGTFMAHSFFDW
jgi:hypothetical protein